MYTLCEPDHLRTVCSAGNGPSGICLSYLLSGYTPYLSPEGIHPNAILQSKLDENSHLSLLEQVKAFFETTKCFEFF